MVSFLKFFEGFFCGRLRGEVDSLRKQVEVCKLEAELQNIASNLMSENWWNGRWRKNRSTYQIQPGRFVDVRTVFAIDIGGEVKLRKVATSWERYGADVIALKALKYVIKRTTYQDDQVTNKTPEYWQDAKTTHYIKKGDCEDGAILILKLMQLAGVPAWRRKLCAGYVKWSKTAPLGGHAYAIYLADDNKWYVLDWCYFPNNSLRYFKVRPHSKISYYGDIWFTCNEQFSWGQKDFKLKVSLKP